MKRILIFIIIFSYFSVQAQNWINIGSGANSTITCLYNDTINHKLCIAGEFTQINGVDARGIATWDGTGFDSLNVGVNHLYGSPSGIKAMCLYNGRLHVGGAAKLGNVFVHGIGSWDGNIWDSLPEVTNGSVSCLLVQDSYLYASGYFTKAGSVTTSSIAKWDGSHWSKIGTGFPYILSGTPNIVSMKFYNGNLFVGGGFDDSTGQPMRLAKFDGVNWGSAGVSIKGSISAVFCMEVYNNELYVAGRFSTDDGNIDNGIIRYDGISWKPVGGGFGYLANISKLQVINEKLYAIGTFFDAGGIPAQKIAIWDGNSWCSLGSDINGGIYGLDEYNGEIYIGGAAIDSIDDIGVPITMFAKWIGGSYIDTCGNLSIGIHEYNLSGDKTDIYPNPTASTITIQFSEATKETTNIEIKNMLGQTMKALQLQPNSLQQEIDVSGLSNGLYFVQCQNKGILISKKFVKQ